MKTSSLVMLCILVILTACAPSPEIVATAMAQTQAALPTDTPLPPATVTFTSTPEPPTSTPTETPTSTPDLQVITADPEELVCTKGDLPIGGYYQELAPGENDLIIKANLVSHYTNEKVLTNNGTGAAGRDFMENFIGNTRRIDGWWVAYRKTMASYPGFTGLQCIVEKYQSIEGAQLAVREYNQAEIFSYDSFVYEENNVRDIGDVSVAISSTGIPEFDQYRIQFSYRNYRVTIIGNGTGMLDDLYYVGEQILSKLKDEPLSVP